LAEDANESQKGFLLNHLLKDEILDSRGRLISNSDPITGQAGWYDVKVSIRPAKADEKEQSFPQFKSMAPLPGRPRIDIPSQAYVAGKVHKK
jgi:hypothetical protein